MLKAELTPEEIPANDSLYHPYWYAIQTRSRHEKIVREQLTARGITPLLPLWRKRSQWKDRIRMIELPLFTGYLFGYFALAQKITVLEVSGVVRVVGFAGHAMPVPPAQIEAIQVIIAQRLSCDPHPYLTAGMRVRVKSGVFAGVEGILITKKSQQRLVLSVDLIQRSVVVTLDSAEVEPLYQASR